MSISEEKMRIVIDNYFKSECDVNTSIRQAFEKGFRIGVKKGQSAQIKTGEWIEHEWAEEYNGSLISNYECTNCHSWERNNTDFCPNCGARMIGGDTDDV